MSMCKSIKCSGYANLGKAYCDDCRDIKNIKREAQKELLDKIEQDLIKESKLIKCKEIHFGELHIVYIRDCLKVLDKYKTSYNETYVK